MWDGKRWIVARPISLGYSRSQTDLLFGFDPTGGANWFGRVDLAAWSAAQRVAVLSNNVITLPEYVSVAQTTLRRNAEGIEEGIDATFVVSTLTGSVTCTTSISFNAPANEEPTSPHEVRPGAAEIGLEGSERVTIACPTTELALDLAGRVSRR